MKKQITVVLTLCLLAIFANELFAANSNYNCEILNIYYLRIENDDLTVMNVQTPTEGIKSYILCGTFADPTLKKYENKNLLALALYAKSNSLKVDIVYGGTHGSGFVIDPYSNPPLISPSLHFINYMNINL